MNLKERAGRLETDFPAVLLALKDRETPWYAKIPALLAVVYALSPVDFIPDFIPVIGLFDDLVILPALIALTIRLIPDAVFARCRECAAENRRNAPAKKWYFAVPFVLLWLLIVFLIVKAVFFR